MAYFEKKNPYDKGGWNNCYSIWCDKIPQSELTHHHLYLYPESGGVVLEKVNIFNQQNSEAIYVQSELLQDMHDDENDEDDDQPAGQHHKNSTPESDMNLKLTSNNPNIS
jgi:hypothetical protein